MLVRRALLAAGLALVLAGGLAEAAAAAANDTTLVSRADGVAGAKQNGSLSAIVPAISGDGRYVAFQSNAPNLGTTTGIYVRDTLNHTTTLVSRANNGDPANGSSDNPAISSDGRYVAFDSTATNLPGDTSGVTNVFVRDMVAGTTTLVSRANNGDAADATAANPSISGDGQRIAFESDATNLDAAADGTDRQVFVRDLTAATTSLVSRANGGGSVGNRDSGSASISADGTAVAFDSQADNLDASDTLPTRSVYIRDLDAASTSLVSRADGAEGASANADALDPSISADGSRVAFSSAASNLVAADSDSGGDVYLRDLGAARTSLISVAANGSPGSGNFDGRPSISADGRIVAFESTSMNLNAGDADGFIDIAVYDTQTAQMYLASRADGAAGAKGDHSSRRPWISADGLKVAFTSEATNLDPDDASVDEDVYTRELDIDVTPPTVSIDSAPPSRTADNTPTVGFSSAAADVVSFQCAVDASAFSACTSPLTTSPLADGSHTVKIRALDTSANIGAPVTSALTIDTTGPTTSIGSAPPAKTADNTPTIAFSSAASDVASFQCAVDTAAFSACSSTLTPAALAEGAHTVKVRALDDLGNTGATAQASFTVDTTGPTTQITSAPSAKTADNTPTISFSSPAADRASFQCAVDSAAFSGCTSPLATAALADGAHAFKVRALDDVGNIGATEQASFTVDTSAPDTDVSGPEATLARKLTVSGKELAAEIGAGAGEDVDATVTASVLVKPKKGRSRTTALAPASGSSNAGKQVTLKLGYKGSKKQRRKLTKKLVEALADGAKATLSAEVVLTDDAGNSSTLERSARLKVKK